MRFGSTNTATPTNPAPAPEPNSLWHRGKYRIKVLEVYSNLVHYRNTAGKNFTITVDDFYKEFDRGAR